jgi:hypothetical protein
MAGVATAGSSGGGSGGGLPPKKPNPPSDIPDDDEDEEVVEDEELGEDDEDVEKPCGRRIQCPTCLRWVLRSVGLDRHDLRCVGYRRFSGNFLCTFPGCHARRSYYHDVTRHFRRAHPGEPLPGTMRAYLP